MMSWQWKKNLNNKQFSINTRSLAIVKCHFHNRFFLNGSTFSVLRNFYENVNKLLNFSTHCAIIKA